MGTHGVFATTDSKGNHECIERTMDGYQVCEAVDRWIDQGCPEGMISEDSIGNGSVQHTRERERGQVYFFHADHQARVLASNMYPVCKTQYEWYEEEDLASRLKDGERLQQKLAKRGWTLDYREDCYDSDICLQPVPEYIPEKQALKYIDERKKKK